MNKILFILITLFFSSLTQATNPYQSSKVGDYSVYSMETKISKTEITRTITGITASTVTIKTETCVLQVSNRNCSETERTLDLTSEERPVQKKYENIKVTQGKEEILTANKIFNTTWIQMESTNEDGKAVKGKSWWISEFPMLIKQQIWVDDLSTPLITIKLIKLGSSAQ